MLISDYLKIRNQQTSNITKIPSETITAKDNPNNILPDKKDNTVSFAEALNKHLEAKLDVKAETQPESQIGIRKSVDFSSHALRRIESRNINMDIGELERLNRGVEIAAEKGSNETLVLVDSTAFVVSVKNNKVITTMSSEDLKGNIFTNIDSTVII